jgi:hypothetical protein
MAGNSLQSGKSSNNQWISSSSSGPWLPLLISSQLFRWACIYIYIYIHTFFSILIYIYSYIYIYWKRK